MGYNQSMGYRDKFRPGSNIRKIKKRYQRGEAIRYHWKDGNTSEGVWYIDGGTSPGYEIEYMGSIFTRKTLEPCFEGSDAIHVFHESHPAPYVPDEEEDLDLDDF